VKVTLLKNKSGQTFTDLPAFILQNSLSKRFYLRDVKKSYYFLTKEK